MHNSPEKTTTNFEEYVPDKGVMPFAPELIESILEGKKVITYRFGTKYDYLEPGDQINIQNSDSKEIEAKATVTDKSVVTFAELPLQTSGHESYKDKEHQRAVLSGYYAYLGRPLRDEDEFLQFGFEVVNE